MKFLRSSLFILGFLLNVMSIRGESEKIKDWTLLIFMSADNNLSEFAMADILEMESQIQGMRNLGATSENINVLVEVDFSNSKGEKGSFRHEIEQFTTHYENHSSIQSRLMQKLPEDYASIKDRFKSFVDWGKKNYPSKHTMVVIWGHGEGYITREEDTLSPKPFGGLAFDESDQSYMTPSELAQSITDKIDILIFDACLMQTIEVLSELRSVSDYIIGSNQIQNYLGLPYRKLLDELQSPITPFELVKKIPKWTNDSWDIGGYQREWDESAYDTFTVSGIIEAQVEPSLLNPLNEVAKELLRYWEESPLRLQDFKIRMEQAPHFQGGSIDLGLFYGILEEQLWSEESYGEDTFISHKLLSKMRKAKDFLGMAITDHFFGPLYYSGNSGADYIMGYFIGVSIWFPSEQIIYDARREEFEKSSLFQQVNSWKLVLDRYHNDNSIFTFGLD